MIRLISDVPQSIEAHNKRLANFGQPQLGEFKYCFTSYYGCGSHLYVYLNDATISQDIITKIVQSNYNYPDSIAAQFQARDRSAKIVVNDSEMGGISIW